MHTLMLVTAVKAIIVIVLFVLASTYIMWISYTPKPAGLPIDWKSEVSTPAAPVINLDPLGEEERLNALRSRAAERIGQALFDIYMLEKQGMSESQIMEFLSTNHTTFESQEMDTFMLELVERVFPDGFTPFIGRHPQETPVRSLVLLYQQLHGQLFCDMEGIVLSR